MQLFPREQHLRRSVYIMFANANNLEELYTDVLGRFEEYIRTNLLQERYDEDILQTFLKSKKYAPTTSIMKEHDNNVNVEIHSRPLLPTINIAPSLKISGQIHTKMNAIGYQHLYILAEMRGSSESCNTDSSDSGSGDCVPLRKKLKTCQKAIEVNCKSMLGPHIKNTTQLTGTTVEVDLLIFMGEEFSAQLCNYLGLIYVESLLKEAEEDTDSVIYRLNYKTAKLYRLIQSYINKYLINGYNNICIVNNISLWENFNANVRAVISTNSKDINFVEAVKISNIYVNLGENNISLLDYVESVALIINKALSFGSHVVAKYACEKNCYRNVRLPLTSIIPLYILRYFRLCRIVEGNDVK